MLLSLEIRRFQTFFLSWTPSTYLIYLKNPFRLYPREKMEEAIGITSTCSQGETLNLTAMDQTIAEILPHFLFLLALSSCKQNQSWQTAKFIYQSSWQLDNICRRMSNKKIWSKSKWGKIEYGGNERHGIHLGKWKICPVGNARALEALNKIAV